MFLLCRPRAHITSVLAFSSNADFLQNCMGNLGRREVGLPLFDQGDYDHHENPLRNAPSSDYYLTTVIENPTKVSFFRIDLKR